MGNTKKDPVEHILPLMFSGLNDELRLKAKEELNETEENRRKGLSNLRQFIKENDLPSELDNDFLLQFLRVAKFDVKKSQERLIKYCDLRRQKNYTKQLDEKRILNVLNHNIVGVLPYRDRHGRAILYVLAHAWNPEICDIEDVAVCLFALIHFVLSFPATTVSGINILTDSRVDYPSYHFSYMNLLKNHISAIMASPLRLQRLDLNNVNGFCRFCYNAIRPILPAKISKRVHLHGDCGGSILKVYPESILPSEFGGTAGPLSSNHFREPLLRFLENLKVEDKLF